MKNQFLDTLTTIEAKVLYERYGIGDLDEMSNTLRVKCLQTENYIDAVKTVDEVAEKLSKDTTIISDTEDLALKKLRLLHQHS